MAVIVYGLQLTEFADKSFALGLSCTHIHNDPTAAALFFQAWAAAHRRTTSTYPPFLHAPALEARDVVVTLPAEATARVCRDGEVLRHGGKVVFGAKAGKEA